MYVTLRVLISPSKSFFVLANHQKEDSGVVYIVHYIREYCGLMFQRTKGSTGSIITLRHDISNLNLYFEITYVYYVVLQAKKRIPIHLFIFRPFTLLMIVKDAKILLLTPRKLILLFVCRFYSCIIWYVITQSCIRINSIIH